MAYNEIKEDSLFVDPIGELLNDPSAANFKKAIAKMLSRMHDPLTVIENSDKEVNRSVNLPKRPLLQWHKDSVVSVCFDKKFVEQNYLDNGTG